MRRFTSQRYLGLLATCVVAAGAALGAGPAGAATDSSLTPTAPEVHGLRPVGHGRKVALAALDREVPRVLTDVPGNGAAFARRGRRLRVGVFRFTSDAKARRALLVAGKGFKRLSGLGTPAVTRARAVKGSARAVVLVRSGRVLGVVRFDTPGRATAGAVVAARAYAGALALRLRRVLGRTAWERTLEGIRDNGSISTGLALRAFAIAYRPLPGVERPAGRQGVPKSATLAMQLVARVWSRLKPAQKAAVDRALGAPHDASSVPLARASGGGLTLDAGYQAIADKFISYYHAKIPSAGPVTVKVYKSSDEITIKQGKGKTGLAYADALPVNANGEWGKGAPAYCRVRVAPLAQEKEGTTYFDVIMAHEVFHCFEFVLMADWRQRTDWLMEGMAEWAAVTAAPAPFDVSGEWYAAYLATPSAALFSRTYSAMGFWGRADEVGGTGSLWGKVASILDAPNDSTSFALAGGDEPKFVETWASSAFRLPAVGGAWYQQLPFAVPHNQQPYTADVVADSAPLDANPYTIWQYTVVKDPSKPLVEVKKLKGALRAGTEEEDLGLVDTDWFCFGGCKCPPGKVLDAPPHHDLSAPLLALGLSGGSTHASGDVDYHSLDEFCKPPSTHVNVSGATNMPFDQPAYCVIVGDELQVQMPWSEGGVKQGHVTLEVKGYHGEGTYTTGPSLATVYDYRDTALWHLWDQPESGTITVDVAGGPYGNGSSGTVNTVSSRDNHTITVLVAGNWAC